MNHRHQAALLGTALALVWVLAVLALVWVLSDEAEAGPGLPMEPTQYERQIVDKALASPRVRVAPDPRLLVWLMRLEAAYGAPEAVSGLIVAQAARESGFNPRAVGDNGRARGAYQLWGHARIDRWDMVASAVFMLDAVAREAAEARVECGLRGGAAWLVGWARALRRPGKPRCDEKPRAWRWLRRWRR
jgi:hypothetical protein